MKHSRRKPDWLKIRLPKGESYKKVHSIIKSNHLNTICTSGKCPNMAECWNAGTATFMILGDICTRSCKFCNTKTGKPFPPDPDEPEKIAESVKLLGLKHVVLTSVDRDDLDDLGANHWASTIKAVHQLNPGITSEVLIPDFQGKKQVIDIVFNANPTIISHNIETVSRLTPQIRSAAKYDVSLSVLKYISDNNFTAKSGLMVGLGETADELSATMDDLLNNLTKILTIGQYLQPTKHHLPVEKYITPKEFDSYKTEGLKKGFAIVESGPLVRSSYHAEKHLL